MHTAPYFAAFGFLTIFHAMRVIRLRWRHKIPFGDGQNAELARMIRVFGNHCEYVPMALILLLCLEMVQAPTWYLHLAGLPLLVGRLWHSQTLAKTEQVTRVRIASVILTFFSLGIAASGVLIWTFISP